MTTLRQDFMKELAKKSEERAGYILSGRCEDDKSYRNAIGFLEGLNTARELFDEVWNKQDS